MTFTSINPASGDPVWTGQAADARAVDEAVGRARGAFAAWSGRSVGDRAEILRAFAARLEMRRAELADQISREIGKPRWEALTEVQSMIGKIPLVLEAHERRCAEFRGGPAVTRFRPHGAVAVFGPFNFPGHLPNGHIAPALLAGNTVLFKPSELAPGVAELTRHCWRESGLPEDVLVVLQGQRPTGEAIAAHPGIDGIFFTGGTRAGRALQAATAGTSKILALEMGGNNPLVVWPPVAPDVAAVLVVQSAFLSAGQRCTCARRLILPEGAEGDGILDRIVAIAAALRVDTPAARPEPFMGPLVTAAAAERVMEAEAQLVRRGARSQLACRRVGPALVTPGILDVTAVPDREDEEVFGPLLQVIRVPGFDAALREANATRFGLAAGLIGADDTLYRRFRDEVRAGIVNWNQQLTGASGAAPFGGIGASGNHRPSGFFAADYCAYPVASIELDAPVLPRELPPGLSLP